MKYNTACAGISSEQAGLLLEHLSDGSVKKSKISLCLLVHSVASGVMDKHNLERRVLRKSGHRVDYVPVTVVDWQHVTKAVIRGSTGDAYLHSMLEHAVATVKICPRNLNVD